MRSLSLLALVFVACGGGRAQPAVPSSTPGEVGAPPASDDLDEGDDEAGAVVWELEEDSADGDGCDSRVLIVRAGIGHEVVDEARWEGACRAGDEDGYGGDSSWTELTHRLVLGVGELLVLKTQSWAGDHGSATYELVAYCNAIKTVLSVDAGNAEAAQPTFSVVPKGLLVEEPWGGDVDTEGPLRTLYRWDPGTCDLIAEPQDG